MDSVVKVVKLKIDSSYAQDIKAGAKEIVGTCLPIGIRIEGKNPKEITAEINAGKWDEKFKQVTLR